MKSLWQCAVSEKESWLTLGSLINHCKLMHPDRHWHLDQAMQRVEEEEEEEEQEDD